MISIRFTSDLQAIALDGDSRLMISYPAHSGAGDCAPYPIVDLTSDGERLVVPICLGVTDWDLLPSSARLVATQMVDRRAGATFGLSYDSEGFNASLDVSMAPEDYDEHTATVQAMRAHFSGNGWSSLHENAAQVTWSRHVNFRDGFCGHLGWSALWMLPAAQAILPELNEHCRVLTVDRYEPGRTGYDGVQWAWREMIVVPDGSVERASEIIQNLRDVAIELTVVGPGRAESYLQGVPAP